MFIDPLILIIAAILIVIGCNVGSPFSKHRFVTVGVALVIILLSVGVEYRRQVAEEKRLTKIAQEEERKRIAEEKRKAEEARKAAAAKAAREAKLKRQKEIAAAKERERLEFEAKQRAEKEAADSKLRREEQIKREEQAARESEERTARVQRRAQSFDTHLMSIGGSRRSVFNATRNCLYYDAKRRRRNNYLTLQLPNSRQRFQITNSYRRKIDVVLVLYDDLENNCRNSLAALVKRGHLGHLGIQTFSGQRIVALNSQGGGSQPTQLQSQGNAQDLVKGIAKGLLDAVIDNIGKKN